MKNYLLALVTIGLCNVAYSQTPAPLPPETAELVAKYKSWKAGEEKVLERKIKEKRTSVIEALLTHKQNATRKGNLNGALSVEREVNVLKAIDAREELIELMKGKWEWNTGSISEFDQAGKILDGRLALWVIDPAERLLYFRASAGWHYDIVLSENGKSFTAKRIQSGAEYSAKRTSN